MHPSAKRTTAVIAVAAAAALAIWAAARLLGVDVEVELGGEVRQVGPVDILVTTVVAGLAAWVVYSILARTPRTARWWPFVGSTGIALSMLGPSYLSDGAAAVTLIAMHLAVGAILIRGLLEARALALTGHRP
jgi:FtsH-binding integral membrane protein